MPSLNFSANSITDAGPLVFQRSRYNYFVRRTDGVMAYNARTGTFAHLSHHVADLIESDAVLDDTPTTAALFEMGFVHHGDEYEQIVSSYTKGKKSTGELNLTLVPTLACNRSCAYCYQTEYRQDSVMSAETQKATIDYIRSRVDEGWKTVFCTWYGGEPLLAKTVVLQMAQSLREGIIQGGGSLQPMKMVTNGVLLDAATAKALSDVGIASVQVSFDSLIDDGDERRGVIDESGNPSLILRNLKAAVEYLKVKIRINVSQELKLHVPQILSILRDHDLEQFAYLARVSDYEGESGAVVNKDGLRQRPSAQLLPIVQVDANTLGRAEFARFEQETMLRKPGAIEAISQKLTPKTHFCSATVGNMFVIDPAGNISRCWLSAGSQSEALGNVHHSHDDCSTADNAQKWRNQSPFVYASCSSCKVLPLCMGGCSHPRLFMQSNVSPCEAIKQQIQQCVEFVGSRLVSDTESGKA